MRIKNICIEYHVQNMVCVPTQMPHIPCKSFTKNLCKVYIKKHIYSCNGHGLVWSHRSTDLVVRMTQWNNGAV
jgi:hypothetical protein